MSAVPSSPIVLLTVAELAALVRDAMRDALPTAQPAPRRPQGDWMTADDVADAYGYARRSVPGLVRLRGLPCERVGRKLRFHRPAVEAWARSRKG